MSRLWIAVRLMLFLPPVWIALTVIIVAVLINGWEPGVDIANYAVNRLFH